MPSPVRHITVDCADPYALAGFWAQVIGGARHPDDRPGEDEALVHTDATGPGLLFLRVPEGKAVKNRVHLDVQPAGPATREDEVERLLGIGATFLADHRRSDGSGFVVLADPEGNEFCVERGEAERTGD
jgi:predicted enzyme related to lactoylglutathione lyase